jgi:hypothetical protein
LGGIGSAIFALVVVPKYQDNRQIQCALDHSSTQGVGMIEAWSNRYWNWQCAAAREVRKREAAAKAASQPAPQIVSTTAPLPAAPPLPVAVAIPPPVVQPTAPAPPLPAVPQITCASTRVPDKASLAASWEQQVCALMACAGRTDIGTVELTLVHEWGALAAAQSGKACLASARASLASQATVNAVYAALESVALPERDPQRSTCRHIKNAMQDTIVAKQQQLDTSPPGASKCRPADRAEIPPEVRRFLEDNRLEVNVVE